MDQCNRWNYCGPSNLTMALNFWGWAGDRDAVAKVIKPGNGDPKVDFIQRGEPDKNVMPYEMVDYVNQETEFRALQRYGGDMALVRRLIVAGFPVIIEKGYYERDYAGKVAWLGHYSFVTGYDEARQVFIWQDTYPPPQCKGNGRDVEVSYTDFEEGWRSFNNLFMVIYPPSREAELLDLLGPVVRPGLGCAPCPGNGRGRDRDPGGQRPVLCLVRQGYQPRRTAAICRCGRRL